MTTNKRVLVVGATGGTGRAAVSALLAQGAEVTAFARRASALADDFPALRTLDGDATVAADVHAAVAGQDAVVVTLGISENPLKVRLFGAGRTADRVRSVGTQHVIDAMRRHGVRKLVVQSSFGVGETRDKLRWQDRLLFSALLRPQIDDTEEQERLVRASGLDWVLAQPVHLTDAPEISPVAASAEGLIERLEISRASVASFLISALETKRYDRRSLALSAAAG